MSGRDLLDQVARILTPQVVTTRSQWRPIKLETVQRLCKESDERKKKEIEARVGSVGEKHQDDGDSPDGAEDAEIPSWQKRYYELRAGKGNAFDMLDACLKYLVGVADVAKLVGGETTQSSAFSREAEALRQRITASQEMLSRPTASRIAVKSFEKNMDTVFSRLREMLFHHVGEEERKIRAATRVAIAIGKLPKKKRQDASDMAVIVAEKSDMEDAFTAEAADNLLKKLEERQIRDEHPEGD